MATVTATFVCVFLVCFPAKALSVTVDAADHSGKTHKGRLIRQEDKMLKVEGNASTEPSNKREEQAPAACTIDMELAKADNGEAGTPCTCGTDENGDDALCRSGSTKARVCTNATAPTCEVICNVTTSSSTLDELRNTASCMCAGLSGSNPAFTQCNSNEICNGNTCKAKCDGEPVGVDDAGCICEAVDGSTPAYTWCTSGQACLANTCTTPTPVCALDVELATTPCTCGTDEDGDDALCKSGETKKRLCRSGTAPTCEVICQPNKKSCMCAGSGSIPVYTKCTGEEKCNDNTCQA